MISKSSVLQIQDIFNISHHRLQKAERGTGGPFLLAE